MGLEQISLRQRERGFVVGGTDTGKSTLADMLGAEFIERYAAQDARRLILDTKPRYRAEFTARGGPAKRRYKAWDHGPALGGSVVVDEPGDLKLAWETGYRTAIAQGNGDDPSVIARLSATAATFLESSRTGRPQLLQVDESMDFFHANGAPIGGNNALVRTARAGRERGTSGLYCSQRTKNIPAQLMSEMSRLYCFRLDFKADARRLEEMGAPPFPLPTKTQQFMYWWKGDYEHVWGPYKLNLA